MQPEESQSETSESRRVQHSTVPAQHLDIPEKRPDTADSEQPHPTLIPDDAQHLEGALILRDGSRIHMRPIRADDSARLQTFHAGLSLETIVLRFFHFVPKLAQEAADRFTHVDYANRMALVATMGTAPDEQIVAVVRYERIGPSNAEVAFVVADAWQGHGIATALLRQLAGYARHHGITTFTAVTMTDNFKMIVVLRTCGFPCQFRYSNGEVEAILDISHPPRALGIAQ
ncbi:MAG TPA: GNAT family N-acetyltransferase [Ktedonobacterales bacterium]